MGVGTINVPAPDAEAYIKAHNQDQTAHPEIWDRIRSNAAAIADVGKMAEATRDTAGKALTTAEEANKALAELVHTINEVPAQIGVLTYTGLEQSPKWHGYDPNRMTIDGTISATDAGMYEATFRLKGGLQWMDGTSDAKTVEWKIVKRSGAPVVDYSGITLPATTVTIPLTWQRDPSSDINSSYSERSTSHYLTCAYTRSRGMIRTIKFTVSQFTGATEAEYTVSVKGDSNTENGAVSFFVSASNGEITDVWHVSGW